MPLHLDYRPKDFDEFVENKGIVDSLKNLITKEDRPHTYLFTGNSGTGKTTLARILANKLKSKDITEINSSNNRGIDTARDIISMMQYKPLQGEIKVYIIDEVHNTTKDWQQAMLKPLEDAPKHVYFFLCTTEPEKLITALKSRCAIFHTQPLKRHTISTYLKNICKKENINLSENVINEITDNCDGALRQALITLDQVREADEENISEIIRQSKIEEQQIINLCRRLLKSNVTWKQIAKTIKGIEAEPEKVRRAVIGYMSSVLLNDENDLAALILDCFKDNFYNTGKGGLILACYEVFKN